eukprot:SAG22_NODE_393_length_11204_cov_5.356686_5_plen_209_part_00
MQGPWVKSTPKSTSPGVEVGWFAGPYIATPAGELRLVGSADCNSSDFGKSWDCTNTVDPAADGGLALSDSGGLGLTGGGEISNPVSGWVHLSTDSGASFDPKRTLTAPYPIRHVGWYGSPPVGIAAGGDYNAGVGGIWSSVDSGKTWKQDVDTGVEMAACASTTRDFGAGGSRGGAADARAGSVVVTCVGSARGKTSVVTSTEFTIGG